MQIYKLIAGNPWLARFVATVDGWIHGLDRRLANTAAWVIAACLLFTLQAALILGHWAWLDEWQALQIAVQSPDLAALLHNLTYEGHPPLWYLILRWTAEFVPLLWVLPVVALVLALITQSLILFASPFTRAERLMVAASQFVLFEMLVVSRSLTLGTMLIVLALVLWQRRWVWLPIALLPMCDFLFGVVSIIFIALQWRRNALYWPGVALWLVVGLAAAWTVLPAPDVVPALADRAGFTGLGLFTSNLGLLLLPFQWEGFAPTWNSRLPLMLMPILWLGFVLFIYAQTARDSWNRAILFGLIGLGLVMSVALYPLAFRHLVIIALMLIALAWIDKLKGQDPVDPGFRVWLGMAAACGLFTSIVNFVQPFDRAHVAAAEIERLGLENERWLALRLDHAQGIPALTGMLFENPSHDCLQSFVPWTSNFRPTQRDEVQEFLENRVASQGQFYMVTRLQFGFLPEDLAQKIAVIPGGYLGKDYELYLVGPDAPKLPRDMPPCVPGTLPIRALP